MHFLTKESRQSIADLNFNHRKQRGRNLDTVRHMQQDEKRKKRGCDHSEVGLVLSCPILSFGTRHRDRGGLETLFDTIRQVNKARPGSRAHFIFSGSIPDRVSQLIDLSPGRKPQKELSERSEKSKVPYFVQTSAYY